MGQALTLGNCIGEGTFGTVYDIPEGGGVVKVLKKMSWVHTTKIDCMAEIDIMFRINSPYLLHGIDILPSGHCGPLVGPGIKMDRMTGSIRSILHGLNTPDHMYIKVLLHLALGLQCLHRTNYLHLDISLSNCMYSGTAQSPIGKLIDYGSASQTTRDGNGDLLPITSKRVRMSVPYRPIENLVMTQTYSNKSDVWALGIVFLEIVSQHLLIDFGQDFVPYANGAIDFEATALRYMNQYKTPQLLGAMITQRIAPHVHKKHVVPITDLLTNMLNYNPTGRFNIDRVVDHALFADIRDTTYNGCTVEIPVLPPLCAHDSNSVLALRAMIHHINTRFPTFDAGFLMCSIDLFMRVHAHIGDTWSGNSILEVAIMCMLVVCRLFVLSTQIPEEYMDVSRPEWKHEEMILSIAKGIIDRSSFFSAAATKEEVLYLLCTICDPENLDSYFKVTPTQCVANIRKIIGVTHTPKHCTIQSLMIGKMIFVDGQ